MIDTLFRRFEIPRKETIFFVFISRTQNEFLQCNMLSLSHEKESINKMGKKMENITTEIMGKKENVGKKRKLRGNRK